MKLDTAKFDYLKKLLEERILVLDGAMGSLIQCSCTSNTHNEQLPDHLNFENPALIRSIHRQYLQAGADIIETNSFNSNSYSLSDYDMESDSYELSKRAANLARIEADIFTKLTPGKPRFVAGSVGPTKHMLSLGEDENLNFDKMSEAYGLQIRGLLDGGADIILLETVFDTLTVKAAIHAIGVIEEERNFKIPVMVSGTISNSSGRLLGGQTIEAFYVSVRHAGLIAFGLNCGFGSDRILPYLRRLSEIADCAISIYPNAGLPDDCGEYHEDASFFANNIEEALKEKLVNIIGGCCGTTPSHIHALSVLAERYTSRPIPQFNHILTLSNLEYSTPGTSREVIQVGERTNVAGSAKFARLIREKNFDEALQIAIKQVKAGAQIIDVCMDDGMENAAENMVKFLRLVNADAETGSVPVMIDSSDWSVILAALKTCQGKGVVNSISLKDGEEEFLRKAREIKRLGAAVVVMLFDERGQAESFERKCEIASRAYNLLLEDDFEPSDIIFDPNVLTVGTGLKEKDTLALDFIRATEWIKANLPYASVSGGISNLSFAFRGNNPLREAMHTVFIYHAARAGMNMAIVNAGMLSLYDDIEPTLLKLIEDLILSRTDSAVNDLISYAGEMKSRTNEIEVGAEDEISQTLEQRIENALLKGKTSEVENLMTEALKDKDALSIVNDFLMPPMKKVGELFGNGRMFLPQVIKSAQVMHKAVDAIRPFMNVANTESNDKSVIIATVKGDVHDIGKNIVGLVVSCNGFSVEDLGVRVEETTIADKAETLNPIAILLSGLISPSLNEMVKVCEELERRGLNIPVIIGGAATSEIHTAVKIAPKYKGPVFYSPDAASNLKILMELNEEKIAENKIRQQELREKYLASQKKNQIAPKEAYVSLPEYKTQADVIYPSKTGRFIFNDIPISEIENYIDWSWLMASLKVKENENEGAAVLREAKQLFSEIKNYRLLTVEGVAEIFEASRRDDDIILYRDGNEYVLPMLRAENGKDAGRSVADFVAKEKDFCALFAVTAGNGLKELEERLKAGGDIYPALLAKLIADRLAEAAARWIHEKLIGEIWNINDESKEKSVRIAFGYPAAPDHTLKRDVFELLEVEDSTNMRLTETSMIMPSESVCGIIFTHGYYMNVGKLGEESIVKYAERRATDTETIKSIIPNNVK